MERLGLGPAECAKRNPQARLWPHDRLGAGRPARPSRGHDLNYLALSGILSLAARDGQAPIAPPTVLGDGGGALGLAFGVIAAVFAAGRSGKGCVIDCSIVDMAASLGGIALSARASGMLDARARARSTTRHSTTSTPAPTDAMSPSARSSRNSMRSCSTSSALRTSIRRRNTIAPHGLR